MDAAANPFAQLVTTPEPIIAQVRRDLKRELGGTSAFDAALLDEVAERTVQELWPSRVKTFVPVLALRDAREALREEGVVMSPEQPAARLTGDDVLAHRSGGSDVLHLDDRDALSVGDDVIRL